MRRLLSSHIPMLTALAFGLALPAQAAPEPPHVPVVLKGHGKTRVAVINGTSGPAAKVYTVATGAGRNLVVTLQTRTAGPARFVVEPEDGGAILYDSKAGGGAISLSVDPNAKYEIRVFNDDAHPQARVRTNYTLRVQVF